MLFLFTPQLCGTAPSGLSGALWKWVEQGHVFHDFQSEIGFLNGRFGQFTAKETDGLSENDNEDLGKFVAHLV